MPTSSRLPHSLQCVIAKPVTDVTGCGNPHPSFPRPPCLKGAGTAKPRLGDSSLSRTPGRAHGPCPTRFCVTGPGRTGSSAPTTHSVGAGVPDGPLTALLAMCHCETSDRCHWLWQSVTPAHRTSCESNDTQIPSASALPLRRSLPFCEKNFLKNKNL